MVFTWSWNLWRGWRQWSGQVGFGGVHSFGNAIVSLGGLSRTWGHSVGRPTCGSWTVRHGKRLKRFSKRFSCVFCFVFLRFCQFFPPRTDFTLRKISRSSDKKFNFKKILFFECETNKQFSVKKIILKLKLLELWKLSDYTQFWKKVSPFRSLKNCSKVLL